MNYYNREGEPIGFDEWGRLYEDRDYQSLAKANVGDVLISTVWLGLDHSFLGQGPPLIFETMVFPNGQEGVDFGDDLHCQRYSTEEQALEGHEFLVLMVRNKIEAVQ